MEQKPYRILQVGMSDNYGGTEAIIYGIYEHLDHSKIQFDFLNVYGHPIARQDKLIAQGAHVYDLLLKRREGYAKYIRGIKEFYKQHVKEFDAVVCNVQCLDQIDMLKWAAKCGIKTRVLHLHNAGNGIKPSRLAKIAIWWNKRTARHYTTRFVAVSSLAAQWGFSKKDAQKALILPNGIDSQHFAFSELERGQFRSKYKIPQETKVYGSAGRFDPQKNQFFLLAIFQKIHEREPSSLFVLAGRGPLESQLKSKANELGIASSLIFITDSNDLASFFSGIDCFILPSLFEGLGIVLLEAQCSGLPCYASSGTIPDEAKILDSFCFLDLNRGPDQWANSIVENSCPNFKRTDGSQFIVRSGRDIRDVATNYTVLFLGGQL
jgi:glycosyltransferase involved in cell wall biosynthesis